MVAKKRCMFVDDVDVDVFDQRLDAIDMTVRERRDAKKDLHLIGAALNHDEIVISLDDNSRRIFSWATRTISEFARVMWVNPCENFETFGSWLGRGARYRRAYTLA